MKKKYYTTYGRCDNCGRTDILYFYDIDYIIKKICIECIPKKNEDRNNKFQNTLTITGYLTLKLYDQFGHIKDVREVANLVVTAGKNYTASWLAASSQTDYFMKYLAIGTGTTAPVSGNTALESEIGTRVVGTITSSANIWQNEGTFGPGNGTGALTEAGLFSASTGGTMLARQTFTVINKGASDSLKITWQITIG